MARYPNVPISSGARRRSQRVLMQVRVLIRGADAQGLTFEEETDTLAISADGGLILLDTKVQSGSIVLLKNLTTQEEQECHVAFLGPVRAGKAEIGLEFSAPRPTFWRIAFPPENWSPKHPEARTANTVRTDK